MPLERAQRQAAAEHSMQMSLLPCQWPGVETVTRHLPNSNLGQGGPEPKSLGHTRRRDLREKHPAVVVAGGVKQHVRRAVQHH